MQPTLEIRGTQFHKAILVEKHGAFALWILASGNSCRTLNIAFGIRKLSAVKIVLEFHHSEKDFITIY